MMEGDDDFILLKLGSLEERKARFAPNITPPSSDSDSDCDSQSSQSSQSSQNTNMKRVASDDATKPEKKKSQQSVLRKEFRELKSECAAKLLLDLWRVPYYNIHYEVHMEWRMRIYHLVDKGLEMERFVDEMSRMVSS